MPRHVEFLFWSSCGENDRPVGYSNRMGIIGYRGQSVFRGLALNATPNDKRHATPSYYSWCEVGPVTVAARSDP